MQRDFERFAVEISSGLTEARTAVPASLFGENNVRWLWEPYIPFNEYSVLMAAGGTGKTILCCGIAAAVSTGAGLPGQEASSIGQNVLIISAEDSGEILKERLKLSGANLDKVFILDCNDSIGLNFASGFDVFEATVRSVNPALVICDPWHGFIGGEVDVNRINVIRPVLQKISHLAKTCDCAVILVSHVNKRAQDENANNAAQGSADFINASRSAMKVIFDGKDKEARILVHTKSNYAGYGRSVRYRIIDGGLVWDGFSEITRETLETAARRRCTPDEVLTNDREHTAINEALIAALEKTASRFEPTKITYEEFKRANGDLIFGTDMPKKALDAVAGRLTDDGFYLKAGIRFKQGNRAVRGFLIQQVEDTSEQTAVLM